MRNKCGGDWQVGICATRRCVGWRNSLLIVKLDTVLGWQPFACLFVLAVNSGGGRGGDDQFPRSFEISLEVTVFGSTW
jgi:hypothetical protein